MAAASLTIAGGVVAGVANASTADSPPDGAATETPRTDPDESSPTASVKLSNERTLSRWAYVRRGTMARTWPSIRSRRLTWLRSHTGDGSRELVLLLSERTRPDGTVWVRVRLPRHRPRTVGWVMRTRLGRYRTVRSSLLIDRRRLRATLYRRGRAIWRAPVGIGKRGAPTPAGRFYVRERFRPRRRGGIYGAYAFGTSARSPTLTDWPGGAVVGIHGTNEPSLIPGRISHGCVRIDNRRITRLRRLMPLGTPVRIT